MKLYSNSLAKTFDSVEETIFFDLPVDPKSREHIAKWIAARQGLEGSYSGMFAPTPADFRDGIRLFTGEVIRSGASLRHVSGEEACRALLSLNSKSADVKKALARATAGMGEALDRGKARGRDWFCCGTCDPSLWRHITAGGLRGEEEWLDRGMRALKAHRDDQGQWRRFPFFYTLLALTEIDSEDAIREIKYAAPRCEKYLGSSRKSSVTVTRRRAVCERALARL